MHHVNLRISVTLRNLAIQRVAESGGFESSQHKKTQKPLGGLWVSITILLYLRIYLPQLSFSVVTRLNTGLPGCVSTRSATK
jgi:hypothetical protein